MSCKTKYPPELKVKIAKECIEGKSTIKGASRKYGIAKGSIQEWIAKYKANGETLFLPQTYRKAYSEETKQRAVKEYLDGNSPITEISAKYGLRSCFQLRHWIKVYNSGEGFRHKMSGGRRMKETRATTKEERIQIAKDCLANGEDYGKIAIKYNVSYQQVYQWVKKYKELGDAGLEDRRGKRLKDQKPRSREEALEVEIARLQHELYMTRMERDLLKKLDEIERRNAYRK